MTSHDPPFGSGEVKITSITINIPEIYRVQRTITVNSNFGKYPGRPHFNVPK
jgi:hypothetical protein